MATAEEGLFDLLHRDGDLQSLVGSRVYPRDAVPSDAGLPRVTYLLVSTLRVQVLRGTTTGKAPLFQIDCWGQDIAKAKAVATAVAAIFQDGYRGALGESGITSKGTIVTEESDENEPANSGEETGIHRVRLGVRIHHAA